ncbi:PLD nuclease N-terminal domain-containing protein [Microbacterium sp. ASV49]|uniref:PLD nuclease N-terminal domain-containing protein n=1 Tax=Microbacterium candidum TaxID=3041922 RepID=A0ABT7N4J4_9MICO|nr:PLD nuclease N-terminal domain-containing protein [Microbacterium sp. ASV49]MDL9981586.1 PLD nuclease N-terminal domain-containing protein [Microbacterium sp. ASV49]
MTRALIILVPLALAFWVFSIVDCAAQPAIRHRAVPKPVWILIVVLIPILGGVLWFAVGRVSAKKLAASPAPDDDPAFLGTLNSHSAQDERIRQLEEELAKLDAEDQAPPPPAKPEKPEKKPRRADDPEKSTDDPAPHRDGDADGRGRHGAIG